MGCASTKPAVDEFTGAGVGSSNGDAKTSSAPSANGVKPVASAPPSASAAPAQPAGQPPKAEASTPVPAPITPPKASPTISTDEPRLPGAPLSETPQHRQTVSRAPVEVRLMDMVPVERSGPFDRAGVNRQASLFDDPVSQSFPSFAVPTAASSAALPIAEDSDSDTDAEEPAGPAPARPAPSPSPIAQPSTVSSVDIADFNEHRKRMYTADADSMASDVAKGSHFAVQYAPPSVRSGSTASSYYTSSASESNDVVGYYSGSRKYSAPESLDLAAAPPSELQLKTLAKEWQEERQHLQSEADAFHAWQMRYAFITLHPTVPADQAQPSATARDPSTYRVRFAEADATETKKDTAHDNAQYGPSVGTAAEAKHGPVPNDRVNTTGTDSHGDLAQNNSVYSAISPGHVDNHTYDAPILRGISGQSTSSVGSETKLPYTTSENLYSAGFHPDPSRPATLAESVQNHEYAPPLLGQSSAASSVGTHYATASEVANIERLQTNSRVGTLERVPSDSVNSTVERLESDSSNASDHVPGHHPVKSPSRVLTQAADILHRPQGSAMARLVSDSMTRELVNPSEAEAEAPLQRVTTERQESSASQHEEEPEMPKRLPTTTALFGLGRQMSERSLALLSVDEAQYEKAKSLLIRKKYHDAVALLRPLADKGHAGAQSYLSQCARKGHGLPKDTKVAFEWAKLSAAQYHPHGYAVLGLCYQEGVGVARDINKAVKCYRAGALGMQRNASSSNDPSTMAAGMQDPEAAEAQFLLGQCYYSGAGVTLDKGKAFEWFSKAAEKNHPEAVLKLSWNNRYQELFEQPVNTPLEDRKRKENMQALVHEFIVFAKRVAQTIVQEIQLPAKSKTIQPEVQTGGQAGGEKFVYGGILLKFARDWKHIYGGDAYAQKAACLELVSMNAVIDCQIPQLHTTLSAVFYIRGHRVYATALAPLHGARSLVYGSADASRTVSTRSASMAGLVRKIADELHLREHSVFDADGKEHRVHIAVDVEGHKSTEDGRYYMVDLGRLCPPVPPRLVPVCPDGESISYALVNKSDFLVRLFRPEFLRLHVGTREVPALSSDAFSMFGEKDSQAAVHKAAVRIAYRKLHHHVIPSVAAYLDNLFGDGTLPVSAPATLTVAQPRASLATKGSSEVPSLSQILHSFGVNMRYLPDVLTCCQELAAQRAVVEEMIARSLKARVYEWLRDCDSDEDGLGKIVTLLRVLFGGDGVEPGKHAWQYLVHYELGAKYGSRARDATKQVFDQLEEQAVHFANCISGEKLLSESSASAILRTDSEAPASATSTLTHRDSAYDPELDAQGVAMANNPAVGSISSFITRLVYALNLHFSSAVASKLGDDEEDNLALNTPHALHVMTCVLFPAFYQQSVSQVLSRMPTRLSAVTGAIEEDRPPSLAPHLSDPSTAADSVSTIPYAPGSVASSEMGDSSHAPHLMPHKSSPAPSGPNVLSSKFAIVSNMLPNLLKLRNLHSSKSLNSAGTGVASQAAASTVQVPSLGTVHSSSLHPSHLSLRLHVKVKTVKVPPFLSLTQAESQYNEALRSREEVLESRTHPQLMSTLLALLKLYKMYGATGKAQRRASLKADPSAPSSFATDQSAENKAEIESSVLGGDMHSVSFQKGELIVQRILEIHAREYQPAALDEIAQFYQHFGRYDVCKKYREQDLSERLDREGADSPGVATLLDCLAIVHSYLGEHEQKKQSLERSLQIKERNYAVDDQRIAWTLTYLGDSYRQFREYDKAKTALERALSIRERLFGQSHPDVAHTLSALAGLYGDLDDQNKRKQLLERVRDIQVEAYGPDHQLVGATLHNLALACGDAGDHQQENALLIQALEILEHAYGANHPELAPTLAHLGRSWMALGDKARAKDLLGRAISISRSSLGSSSATLQKYEGWLKEAEL